MISQEIKDKLKTYLANDVKVISGIPVGIPDALLSAAKAAEGNLLPVTIVGCTRITESANGKFALLFFTVQYDNVSYELLLPLVAGAAQTSAVLKLTKYTSKTDGRERDIFNIKSVWRGDINGQKPVETFTENQIMQAVGLA